MAKLSIQMLSGTFSDQSLPTDGVTKATLLSIPFSVDDMSDLAVTSLVDIISVNAGSQVQVTCEVDIDGVAFFSVTTALIDYVATSTTITGNNAVGVTSTTPNIAPGNHTLTVKCLVQNAGGGTTFTAHSRGTSVIIVS